MIYVLIGPPATGKTTTARSMVRHLNAVIVSRDSLRESLFGYKPSEMSSYYSREDIADLEKAITGFQNTMIKQAIKDGKDVIIDNTNLKLKFLNQFKNYGVPVTYLPQHTSLGEAIGRDAVRERVVGVDYINKAFADYENLKQVFDFKPYTPEPIEPIIVDGRGLPSVFVFDIDGTLALNVFGRSPFDWAKVGEDVLNLPVATVYHQLRDGGYDIVVCSGRDEICRPETERWLEFNGLKHEGLYMRPQGDYRKDSVVKEELWRQIAKKWNIVAMFDDRNQVVEHGRKLGFTVFQVADGNF